MRKPTTLDLLYRMYEAKGKEMRLTDQLRDKAVALLEAAQDYWNAYHEAGKRGAVVWLQDTTGRTVIVTRGEYRDILMRNICDEFSDRALFFGGAEEETQA